MRSENKIEAINPMRWITIWEACIGLKPTETQTVVRDIYIMYHSWIYSIQVLILVEGETITQAEDTFEKEGEVVRISGNSVDFQRPTITRSIIP